MVETESSESESSVGSMIVADSKQPSRLDAAEHSITSLVSSIVTRRSSHKASSFNVMLVGRSSRTFVRRVTRVN